MNDNIIFGPGSFSGNSTKEEAGSAKIKIPIDQYFSQSNGAPTTITVAMVKDERIITVANASTFSIGDVAFIFAQGVFYTGRVLLVAGLDLTMDTLINFPFPVDTPIQSVSREMTVDGSTVPQKFEIFIPDGLGFGQINVSNIVFECLTTGGADLSTFGDIEDGLTNGLMLRGEPNPLSGVPTLNLWNAKTNGQLSGLCGGDLDFQSASNPQQGQNGFLARYTFGGEDKHDVLPGIAPVDALQIIVQDALQTLQVLVVLYRGNLEL